MIEDNEFRLDLFHRLNGFEIQLPPLREREGDLKLLLDHFLKRFNAQLGKSVTEHLARGAEADGEAILAGQYSRAARRRAPGDPDGDGPHDRAGAAARRRSSRTFTAVRRIRSTASSGRCDSSGIDLADSSTIGSAATRTTSTRNRSTCWSDT